MVAVSLAGCSGAPSRDGLVAKLQQRNGLTRVQARCVADGLYGGVPTAHPPIRALTAAELRAVAKPDNAGKVSADVTEVMRSVITTCVPATAAGSPSS